ncbi:MAG: DUF4347 domain-containing protein, partial [Syntrophobacterales bacterium]|nr:DUF4347 domain-containing protein [Syntrophobacterales bacterium]
MSTSLMSANRIATGNNDITNVAENPKVLLISSFVDNAEILAQAVADGVIVVRYNPQTTSLDVLNTMIKSSLNGMKAISVCIAAHDYGENKFYLTSSETISLGSTLSSVKQRWFWSEMGDMIAEDGRIDLLSCKLAAGDNGALLIASLESAADINFAASTNPTGNLFAGGDWMLETDGIDAANEYFNSEMLGKYPGLLWNDEQMLTASDKAANDKFGVSVAISGDYALIGAHEADPEAVSKAGKAYIFKNVSGAWTQQGAALTASDKAA